MSVNKNISLLDCTLRDGAHVTGGNFGMPAIRGTIENLVEAKVDIIEVGFFNNEPHKPGSTFFSSIADVRKCLPKNKGVSSFSLMADFVDVSKIEPFDGTIEYFRLSFKRHRLNWALDSAHTLMDKGYKVFINPVNCNVYTTEQYLDVIKQVNELKPYAFSIVDTFGVMRKQDLSRIYYLVEGNLDEDITIGLHLHENLGLAFSLAQHFLEIRLPKRNITIDCSLLGMGRAPGNLCAEQIMDHMNINYGAEYNTEPALDAGDDYIAPIKREKPWGYAIPYALSGKYGLHRTYAEFLMNRHRLKTKDIQRILSLIDKDHIEMFDEDYVEGLYRDYMSTSFDDTKTVTWLKNCLKNKRAFVICPGSSIKNYKDKISSLAGMDDVFVLSVNFSPDFIKPDCMFCANVKRVDNLRGANCSRIVTSNIVEAACNNYEHVVSYNDCVYFNEVFCEDTTLMLLHFLQRCGCTEISIAGFDGFSGDGADYYTAAYTLENSKKSDCSIVDDILQSTFADMNINFVTPSVHER